MIDWSFVEEEDDRVALRSLVALEDATAEEIVILAFMTGQNSVKRKVAAWLHVLHEELGNGGEH